MSATRVFTMFMFALAALYIAGTGLRRETPVSAFIESTHYTPGYYENRLVTNRTGTTVVTVWVPASWSARVRYDGSDGTVSCPITERQYTTMRVPADGVAMVATGRLSGSAYCNGIREAERYND